MPLTEEQLVAIRLDLKTQFEAGGQKAALEALKEWGTLTSASKQEVESLADSWRKVAAAEQEVVVTTKQLSEAEQQVADAVRKVNQWKAEDARITGSIAEQVKRVQEAMQGGARVAKDFGDMIKRLHEEGRLSAEQAKVMVEAYAKIGEAKRGTDDARRAIEELRKTGRFTEEQLDAIGKAAGLTGEAIHQMSLRAYFALSRIQSGVQGIGNAFKGMRDTMVGATLDVAAHIHQLQMDAERIGMAGSDLEKLQFAMERMGGKPGTALTALERFSQQIEEAVTGSKAAQENFAKLGVSIVDAAGDTRPMLDILYDVADAFERIADPKLALGIAKSLFGRGAGNLFTALREGADELRKLMEEAEALGVGFSDEDLERAEKLHEAWVELQHAWQELKEETLLPLMPWLTEELDKLKETVSGIREWVKAHEGLVASADIADVAIGAIVAALGEVVVGVIGVVIQIRAMQIALADLATTSRATAASMGVDMALIGGAAAEAGAAAGAGVAAGAGAGAGAGMAGAAAAAEAKMAIALSFATRSAYLLAAYGTYKGITTTMGFREAGAKETELVQVSEEARLRGDMPTYYAAQRDYYAMRHEVFEFGEKHMVDFGASRRGRERELETLAFYAKMAGGAESGVEGLEKYRLAGAWKFSRAEKEQLERTLGREALAGLPGYEAEETPVEKAAKAGADPLAAYLKAQAGKPLAKEEELAGEKYRAGQRLAIQEAQQIRTEYFAEQRANIAQQKADLREAWRDFMPEIAEADKEGYRRIEQRQMEQLDQAERNLREQQRLEKDAANEQLRQLRSMEGKLEGIEANTRPKGLPENLRGFGAAGGGVQGGGMPGGGAEEQWPTKLPGRPRLDWSYNVKTGRWGYPPPPEDDEFYRRGRSPQGTYATGYYDPVAVAAATARENAKWTAGMQPMPWDKMGYPAYVRQEQKAAGRGELEARGEYAQTGQILSRKRVPVYRELWEDVGEDVKAIGALTGALTVWGATVYSLLTTAAPLAPVVAPAGMTAVPVGSVLGALAGGTTVAGGVAAGVAGAGIAAVGAGVTDIMLQRERRRAYEDELEQQRGRVGAAIAAQAFYKQEAAENPLPAEKRTQLKGTLILQGSKRADLDAHYEYGEGSAAY